MSVSIPVHLWATIDKLAHFLKKINRYEPDLLFNSVRTYARLLIALFPEAAGTLWRPMYGNWGYTTLSGSLEWTNWIVNERSLETTPLVFKTQHNNAPYCAQKSENAGSLNLLSDNECMRESERDQ